MSLGRLAVYTTGHGIDSVEAHLDRLDSADASPEFVALELPDVDNINEDLASFSRKVAKRSPATGIVWHIIERIEKRGYEKTDNKADREDAEFEAGRQYADQHGIPHDEVDLKRSEIAKRYATWPHRLRDAAVLLIGSGITVAVWGIAALCGLGGIVVLANHGFTLQGILSAALRVGLAFILLYLGRLPALFAIGKIGYWFLDTIREHRDEAMYRQIKDLSEERSATEGLLIVGANHFSGIKAITEQDNVECWQIESPAISRYDGELERISPQEISELTQTQNDT